MLVSQQDKDCKLIPDVVTEKPLVTTVRVTLVDQRKKT